MIGYVDNVSGPAGAALAALVIVLWCWADLPARYVIDGFFPAMNCAGVCKSLGPWSVHHVGGHTQDRIVGQAVDL